MPGLLDDPMMSFAMGLLEAGGSSPRPVTLGQALARGYGAAQESEMMSAKRRQMEQHNQMLAMQMEELKRQQLDDLAIRNAAKDSVLSPQQQAIAKFGPTNEGAQAIPSFKPQFDMNGFVDRVMAQNPLAAMKIQHGMQKAPIKLAEGEKLIDPVTFSPLASGNPKAETVPSEIKEYQFAVSQGYKGTFQQYQTDMKKAGAATSMTQIITPKDIIGYERDMRKDFEGLDPVKNYRLAFPAYSAIKDAASRNTTQADINLVYGIAKLYDPTSVVREGEYNTIANSQSVPEKIKGLAQYIQGGGRLTPETKQQLVKESEGRIGVLEGEYVKAHGTYKDIAKRQNLNANNIFTPIGRVGSDGTVKRDEADKPGKVFDAMPSPVQYKGRRIRGDDGATYRSNGMQWVRE